MEFYSIFIPNKTPDFPLKSFYTDKEEALKVLKSHKEARLKAFKTSSEAFEFYIHGPVEIPTICPKSPNSMMKSKLEKTPFKAPKSQELVAFRKLIESNNLELVTKTITDNPRYLVSSGDTPTILKEGPRYNALHVSAISKNGQMCKLILQTIEKPAFIELLHGQRSSSTDEVSAILLDLYLNMPDKGRSETPLHFAAKFGAPGVVEALIAYPQCKFTQNSDGLYPKDIICFRSNDNNPELKKSIENLLKERFFVPVFRSVDNSMPPVVGEPFTPANPPSLVNDNKFSPKMEIKAYAGPMDKEKAQIFFKRLKTPPRLIISPSSKFKSPNKSISMSRNNTNPFISPTNSSTPISKKAGRRTLFPNKSFELNLDLNNKVNSINNNEIADIIEEAEDNNGNHITSSSSSSSSPPEVVEPITKPPNLMIEHLRDKLLFKKYRERIQNSFSTICDDDEDHDLDDLDEDQLNQSKNAGNYSYFCDENNSFYENDNVFNSPSHKERNLRIKDTGKGLEIIGRDLADFHGVGWNEFWDFLGTFTNIKSDDGLTQFEAFLSKRKQSIVDKKEVPQITPALNDNPNDSLQAICACLDKMKLQDEDEAKSKPALNAVQKLALVNNNHSLSLNNHTNTHPHIHSQITKPYLCLDNSLQVFAKRFLKYFDSSSYHAMDFDAIFRTCMIECMKKLHTLVDNYRKDGTFSSIDFNKMHSRYAYLIVTNIDADDGDGEIYDRFKAFLKKCQNISSTNKGHTFKISDGIVESIQCLQRFLKEYILKKDKLMTADVILTEEICRKIWNEDCHIKPCICKIETAISKKGSLDRMNKRREYRKKFITNNQINNFSTYRNPVEIISDTSDDDHDDEDDFYSCSSGLDSDDEMHDTYLTPPNSPSFFEDHFEGFNFAEEDEDVSDFINFIEGDEPTKQDVDVWNALEKLVIDRKTYPNIHRWRLAISKYSAEDRESFPTKALKVHYRIGSNQASSTSTPLSVSKAFRLNSIQRLPSIEQRLNLMNVSDYGMRTPPAPT